VSDFDIPTEALEAAEQVLASLDPERDAGSVRRLVHNLLTAAAPHLIAAGRKAHWEDLARQALADQPGVDETPALMTKVEKIVRAKVAAEIRAADVEYIVGLQGDTTRIGLTVAARIAEGGGTHG